VERIVYKNGDDVAVSVARSFERLEERMDAMEARLYSRLADIESVTQLERADIARKFDAHGKDVGELVGNIDRRLTELLEG
jgi:hypothetical protein